MCALRSICMTEGHTPTPGSRNAALLTFTYVLHLLDCFTLQGISDYRESYQDGAVFEKAQPRLLSVLGRAKCNTRTRPDREAKNDRGNRNRSTWEAYVRASDRTTAAAASTAAALTQHSSRFPSLTGTSVMTRSGRTS